MDNIKVYLIANLKIQDKDAYRKYEKGFFPILRKHGGEFITYDDSSTHLEGTEPLSGRVILFCFPSEEAASNWFSDHEYQELAEHRREGAPLVSLTMVKGLPPRE
tara:strand:- start:196 stop:510 length:315 start_codon:yes stop_codon:yes gene_type:complete